jgi:hypothetical protein
LHLRDLFFLNLQLAYFSPQDLNLVGFDLGKGKDELSFHWMVPFKSCIRKDEAAFTNTHSFFTQ